MAGEPPAQKKRRLPFKPPSRAPSAGPSTSAPKPKSKNTKTNKTSTKASTAASSSKASAQTKSKATTTTKRPRAQSPPESAAESDSGSESASSVHSRERSISQEPDYILAEIVTNSPSEDVASSDPTIPPKLLTRLLHQQFTNEKTKVAKDANAVVAKYVDVFVREAIARAAYERAETDNRGGKGASDGFLEVNPILFPRSFLLTDGVSGN
ncbi:uncharacterized protein N7469_003139 [Penicillium citrinum]|uniref:Uncharacterized protein n=1 Tax=Penicillium citrinum TaxID=5077 RepID=A0A9W9PBM6_PENCI|nr:uncharacterized protein N7469_003139 [Penicillium citrinum]KAJ5241548.1 hypothetical protein N7469_003139 [Penicillium citrinum]KAK5789099.1 hypothetical protein VI817_008223 [Penicillium citrinum]